MKVFGFPLRVDPAFVIIMIALGSYGGGGGLVAFVVAGALAILIHELGHAFAARWLGARDVRIALVGTGGLTSFGLPQRSRPREAIIAFAGPATGLVLGGVVWLARLAADPAPYTDEANLWRQLLFVTFGWAVLNLLPVLPLDGGNLLEQLVPGSASTRARTAAAVTVLVAAGVSVWGFTDGQPYLGVVFALLGVRAVTLLRPARPGEAPASSVRPLSRASGPTPTWGLLQGVLRGDVDGAAAAIQAGVPVEPSLAALVGALQGAPKAESRLVLALSRHPDDVVARTCLILWRSHQRQWQAVLDLMSVGSFRVEAVHRALDGAHSAGAFAAGAAIGEKLSGQGDAALDYNTACCWSLAGYPLMALEALRRAVAHGWTDLAQLDADPDLEPVRELGEFAAWRLNAQEAVAT